MKPLFLKRLVGAVLFGAICSMGYAAEFQDYPQFRYASGLPGGSHGVTPTGHVGFAGAFQLCIPIGYTPGWNNYMLTISAAAINGGFPSGLWGADNNGTVTLGIGLFDKPRVWFSEMGTGKGKKSHEPVENLQIELVRESENCPGISVGVIDIFNVRASTLKRPFDGDARSFYIAATKKAGSEKQPVYYTLGFGNGRYHNRPFGGISTQFAERWQGFIEYDGWVGNVGLAYDLFASRDKEWHGILGFNLVDFERIDLTFAITKTNF